MVTKRIALIGVVVSLLILAVLSDASGQRFYAAANAAESETMTESTEAPIEETETSTAVIFAGKAD